MELLEKRWRDPRADPRLMDKSAEGIEAIHDASLVLSVLVQL